MRGMLGLVGIVLALALVGVLVKQQMGAAAVVPAMPSAASVSVPATVPGATAQEQSLQLQQQVKQSVEGAMQAPRGEPAQ